MNKYLEYYSHQQLHGNQSVAIGTSHASSRHVGINEKSTPNEIAALITKKLIDVIEQDLGNREQTSEETKTLTPMEKFTQGYESFVPDKDVISPHGKESFANVIKKASRSKQRGSK